MKKLRLSSNSRELLRILQVSQGLISLRKLCVLTSLDRYDARLT